MSKSESPQRENQNSSIGFYGGNLNGYDTMN